MMQLGSAKLLYRFRNQLGGRLGSAVKRRLNPSRGRFLVPGLGFEAFESKLRERRIGHVLLPSGPASAEPELLVDDAGLDDLADLVTTWPAGAEIKLYSAAGRPGFTFRPPPLADGTPQSGMALLPPHLAEQLLNRAVASHGGSRVLGADDAFLTFAYRAAYLERDCWTFDEPTAEWQAVPAWDAELRRRAAAAGVDLPGPVTALQLDRLLETRGWRPALDLLERTAPWMVWIKGVLPDDAAITGEPAGLTVFFLRQRAVEAGFRQLLLDSVQDNGFEPLLVLDLDPTQREQAALAFRGGNWGAGPFKVSGGPPAVLAITLDLLPLPLQDDQRALYPGCDNLKIVKAKIAARDLINARLGSAERYNALHSTDSSPQAWRVVRQLCPEREQDLRRHAEQMRREFATDGAIKDLSRHGRRAKVELIEFEGELAVRKTFRSTALRFMDREIEVMTALAPLRPEIPRLLGRGQNHIIIEYVGEGEHLPVQNKRGRPNPLPLAEVRRLAGFLKTCFAQGFDPLDLRAPGNISFTPSGMKVIDYELWRRCDPGVRPEDSFCLQGVPIGDDERPRGIRCVGEPYSVGWFPYTLLSPNSFLYDPAWLQHLKRGVNFTRLYARWAARGVLKRGARLAIGSIGLLASTSKPTNSPAGGHRS
jgi:hypothetical protein